MSLKHAAIIMDGNRRFAKRLMKEPWKGHEQGAGKLKSVLEWCKEKQLSMLTVYAFSYENFNRPKDEFEYLMKIFDTEISELLSKKEDLAKEGLRIHCLGRISMFPESLHAKMKELMDVTKDNTHFTLNICLAYSGRIELVDAFTALQKSGEEISVETIKKHLYIQDEPEIIIRTGGEKRLSNFLTFQSVYSELFFSDSLWPEFSKEEFDSIIDEFNSRDRRFGK